MSAARQVLQRLLRRAESARRRRADEQVSLRMASVAEYAGLRSLAELDDFHAAIVLAERDGAIAVQRESRSGDGSRLLRISVAELAALARHLGVELLDDRVEQAARLLQPWRERFPILEEVLDTWRANRKLRGAGPEAAADGADAARAVAARLGDAGTERILRRESVRLFGDSKRLEKLTPWLEILVTGELAASGLAKEEVWSSIGLRREPQPLLLTPGARLDRAAGDLDDPRALHDDGCPPGHAVQRGDGPNGLAHREVAQQAAGLQHGRHLPGRQIHQVGSR